MPPALCIDKYHNLASPKVLNSQQTSTCPNGLAYDANCNCPIRTTNQQGGSASSNNKTNNNPTSGHHHKGSNQYTQLGGESTVTKKHNGSKTDQWRTQSIS